MRIWEFKTQIMHYPKTINFDEDNIIISVILRDNRLIVINEVNSKNFVFMYRCSGRAYWGDIIKIGSIFFQVTGELPIAININNDDSINYNDYLERYVQKKYIIVGNCFEHKIEDAFLISSK